MKKIILLIALTVISMVTNAQSFFDSLEDMDGVDMVVVNQDMFELLSKFGPDKMKDNEAMQIFTMIKDLKKGEQALAVLYTYENTINKILK